MDLKAIIEFFMPYGGITIFKFKDFTKASTPFLPPGAYLNVVSGIYTNPPTLINENILKIISFFDILLIERS